MKLISLKELETQLFLVLKSKHPSVFGHITEVHAGRWWVCNVYAPSSLPHEEFSHAAVHLAVAVLRNLWPEEPCQPFNGYATGVDQRGQHFCVYWLPVPPLRSIKHFQNFSPSLQPSS